MTQNKELRSFIFVFALFGLLAGALGFLVLVLSRGSDKYTAFLFAWSLSFVVIFLGYSANRWAFARSHQIFYSVLLGGMALRILLIVAIVLLIYFKQLVPILPFLIILAIYYFVFQIVEVVLINNQLKNRNKMDSK